MNHHGAEECDPHLYISCNTISKSLLPVKFESLLQGDSEGLQQFFTGVVLAIYPRYFFNPSYPPIIFSCLITAVYSLFIPFTPRLSEGVKVADDFSRFFYFTPPKG